MNHTHIFQSLKMHLDLASEPLYKDEDSIVRAEWQNGDAEDCKSFNVGSIPASASIF